MADVQKMARDSAMVNGTVPSVKTQASRYDEGLKKQYFADQTRLYADKIGAIASNVYDAQCQGIGSGDFYAWNAALIRVSPAAIASTGETMPDDWQKLHVLKPLGVDTVPIGAYLTFAGNTWIVYKGRNMGSVLGDGIIRRCNAAINVRDWYGNIVPVPMSYAKIGTLGNASHATENSIVAKNYISCVCQLNETSADFHENTRIILGNTAYSMRGLNNFTREFTDDPDSVHMMTFTIERSELLPQDSVEHQCADYGSFSWEISIDGRKTMTNLLQQTLQVTSVRNGETVLPNGAHPFGYIFSSSDENVATVTAGGVVRAKSNGTAVITVRLSRNPAISASITITVDNAPLTSTLQILDAPKSTLREYESTVIKAGVVKGNGVIDYSVPLTFQFSGPPQSCYLAVNTGSNAYTITCYVPSQTPLEILVSDTRGNTLTEEILLTASN